MAERPNRLIQVGIVLGFLGTVVVNALANILPINGVNTGQLSDEIPNLFVPVGLTFSIWGVIYLMLALFTGYSIIDWFRKSGSEPVEDREFIAQIGIPFIITSIANIAWIFLWHYRLVGLSLPVMLVILGGLIYSHLVLSRKAPENVSWQHRWLVKYPISVYLGWITVATVANVTAVLVVNQWNGFGISDAVWTIAMVVIAGLITVVMVWREGDVPYALVVIWAFVGIILKRADPLFPAQPGIIIATAVMIGAIVASIVLKKLKKK